MQDRRTKNILIFKNTEHIYQNNKVLKAAIIHSVDQQEVIFAEDTVDNLYKGGHSGTVVVSGKRTLEASEPYAKQGKKVCVLNFASATNPGGGVVHGASAQEEAICRSSTLYPCLDRREIWKQFYLPHRRANNPL